MSADPITTVDRRFAERVLMLREARELSRSKLEEQAGLPTGSLYTVEVRKTGQAKRRVSIGEAVALARALGVDLAHLIADDVMDVPAALGGGR